MLQNDKGNVKVKEKLGTDFEIENNVKSDKLMLAPNHVAVANLFYVFLLVVG